ncbi:MAG: metal-dependent transcriptional regulator [Pseudomonadota bacterium]|nr:metal-dependent transcriptional regulator [Pseudomonadota bacterium]
MTNVITPDLSPTQEDYLSAIYQIIKTQQVARVNTIAKKLRVGLSTVTAALKSLAAKELIHYQPYSYVTLTETGTTIGEQLAQKHQVLLDFLTAILALPPDEAEINAHRLEHAIDEEVLQRIISFIYFLKECPRGGMDWIKEFHHFYETGSRSCQCEQRFNSWLTNICPRRTNTSAPKGETSMNVTLAELKPSEQGTIITVRGAGPTGKRLMEMGFTPGSTITVEKIAPLGDPIEVRVKGYHLSLRREEAAGIKIEKIIK